MEMRPSDGTHWSSKKNSAATRTFLRFCVDMEIIEDFDKERFGEYLGELRTGRD